MRADFIDKNFRFSNELHGLLSSFAFGDIFVWIDVFHEFVFILLKFTHVDLS